MIRKILSILFVRNMNKNTLVPVWFHLADVIYVEEKGTGAELASIWEEGDIIMVRRVILKENAPS